MTDIVLVCDSRELKQELTTIITFLGDICKSYTLSEAKTLVPQMNGACVIIELNGSELVDSIIKSNPMQPFIGVASEATDDTPHHNLVGVLALPVTYPELTRAIHHSQEYVRQQPVRHRVNAKTKLFRSLVGHSEQIQAVRRMIEQVAPTDANVLVLGESGTGKEVVARNVHFLSNRKDKPFIPVNCGAIPGELLESELFGHEKGAFTGAISNRKGRFELAEGGTLFLDEIGDMPLQMQVKLLRVLQERTYERVGGTKPIQCNVRIVAATHRNLETMIEENKFREDLYYRLNVFPIESPSLRERKDDIPLLLQELISRMEGDGSQSVRFTENAIASLMQHKWAGNVRELSNLVERLGILFPNQIVDVADLPPKYQHGDIEQYEPDYPEEVLEREAFNELFAETAQSDDTREVEVYTDMSMSSALPDEGVNLKEYLSELEINLIHQALVQTDWVVARAADKLGMRRTTLVEKMRKYDIQRHEQA